MSYNSLAWSIGFERHLNRVFGASRAHFVQVVLLLIRRELKVKYAGSLLGYLWSMLNPLLSMLVISFVFSHFVRDIDNYPIFVLSGIIFWNMASFALVLGTNSIVANTSLIRKIKLPGWVFPSVSLGTASVNLSLSLIPYSLLYLVSGASPTVNIFLFPLALLLFVIFLGGLVMTLSTLNVFFRDVSHVLEPVLGLVFYATPLLYNRNSKAIPPEFANLLLLNPFTHFIETLRATLYEGRAPSLTQWATAGSISFVSALIGTIVYKKAKNKIIFKL